jgi:hypothetical protein
LAIAIHDGGSGVGREQALAEFGNLGASRERRRQGHPAKPRCAG